MFTARYELTFKSDSYSFVLKMLMYAFFVPCNWVSIELKTHRTIILPVMLYGCETWSLTLRGKRRLRVFGNRVLRRIFGPRRDEVTGEWKKLHNEELNDLYSSPNIVRVIKSRRMRWAGHVARMRKRTGVCRVLVGKPEDQRPLGETET